MNTTIIPTNTIPTNSVPSGRIPADDWMTVPSSSAAYRPDPVAPKASQYDAGIDQVRYWVGAGLTALVAALVGIVGLVVAHGIVHVPVLLGSGSSLTPVHSALYGLSVVGLALAAAGLYDGMLHVAPRPVTYYGWIVALVTALATLLPFTTTVGLHSQIAFAVMNLAVGLSIAILVPLAAVNAAVSAPATTRAARR
jgi:Family of unknown function (DUF6069)